MKEHTRNITNYFIRSLKDAQLTAPSAKDLNNILPPSKKNKNGRYILTDQDYWNTGKLDKELTKEIFKKTKNKNKHKEVEIVVIPRIDVGKTKTDVMTPLLIVAKLDKEGTLSPTEHPPWIPRDLLEPLGPNANNKTPIASLNSVDEFIDNNYFYKEDIKTWEDLTNYCCNFLSTVINKKSDSIFDLVIHDSYKIHNDKISIIDAEAIMIPPIIQKTLESLRLEKRMPPLYEQFCSKENANPKPYVDLADDAEYSKQHVGQMSGEFVLAPNQRNALHHSFAIKKGDILAVNGPPGTGKTTLLRSVVANMWVDAAIEESDPPIILACSNNNQAVTNILDSFNAISESGMDIDENIKGRWLSGINTYGLYACRATIKVTDYAFYKQKAEAEDSMDVIQSQNYDDLQEGFLEKFNTWNNSKLETIEESIKVLHKRLTKTKKYINKGVELKSDFFEKIKAIESEFGSYEGLFSQITNVVEALASYETQHEKLINTKEKILDFWRDRSFFVKLFMWLPLISVYEHKKNKEILECQDIDINSTDYSDKNTDSLLDVHISSILEKINIEKKSLVRHSKTKEVCNKSFDALCDWMIQFTSLDNVLITSALSKADDVIDTQLRFYMFKLATHYWEAQWLVEMNGFDAEDDKKSKDKILRKYRRFAKITPCFVSTLYTAPTLFKESKKVNNKWTVKPLYDEIDLLIIDEAGQATPEVASACFALAKKAMIVGDTDQIEPVWNVNESIDWGNLEALNLLNKKEDEQYWLESGLMSSCGNVMQVSQNKCQYHQFANLELPQGLYLTEHRRCYNEIINYCNDLVYKGVLDPLRGDPKEVPPWGVMSYHASNTEPSAKGTSKVNEGEAELITKWLLDNKQSIVDYARKNNPDLENKDEAEILGLSVGIITPFKPQTGLITKKLKKHKMNTITVGTVHSFQGAERLIIIFSSVDSKKNNTRKFYDRGKNMLNVAASRAKDSFIVFGGSNFGGDPNSPSGKLKKRLTTTLN